METVLAGGMTIEPAELVRLLKKPALTERGLVDRVIRYANVGDARSWASLMQEIELPEPPAGGEQFMALFAGERSVLRAALTAIVEKAATSALINDWRQRARGALLLPTKIPDAYHYIVWAVYAPPPNALLARALVLLLDRPFGRDLCQCQLEGCGKFFFTGPNPKGGRPRRRYCDLTHMRMAHEAAALERVRRSREKRKRLPKKRRA